MGCICEIKNRFDNLRKKHDTKLEKDSKYHSLTPINSADNCGVYMDALQEALQNPDIKNIAVTGPYGSGKSSVIRTFFDRHNGELKLKHLTITLATFTPTKEDIPDVDRCTIESSILEQLFYHEKDSNIPDSRFKKIHKQPRKKLFIYALIATLYISLVVFLLSPTFLKNWILGTDINDIVLLWFNRIAFLLCLMGAIFVLYKIARILLGLSVKRLNFKSTEVEIANNNQKSALNHHIDEIIYFFDVTGCDVVILEDLDRFDNQEIFTKLREINYLINNSKKVEQKVVFIYAIKDEMFHDKDRTKFFDFIIPIVPIINSSNSGEILRKEFLIDSQKTDITEDVINDLSLFIDDMRLLYNIINEYKIYNQRMSACTLDNNRLLAMISYKNLFPKDFTNLSQGTGILYNVIAQKEKFVQEFISQNRSEIKSISNKIKQIEERERPKNLQELRILYLSKVVDKLQNTFGTFYFNGNRISIYDCAKNDDYFDKIRTGNFTIYNKNGYTSSPTINFSAIEHEVDPHMTYQQRVELLNQSQIKPLQQQIKQLENQIEAAKNYTLTDLIVEGKIKIADVCKHRDKTNLDNTKQIELIDILLRNGYINENYIEYISIFHEGSLTIGDKQFLINVKRRIKTEYNHQLSQIKNLIVKIKPNDFGKWYILNFDVVDFLLSNEYIMVDETEERKQRLFAQLSTMKAGTMQFIIQYLERKQNTGKFLHELCCYGRNIWRALTRHVNNIQELQYYFQQIIKHVSIDDIVNQFYLDETNYIQNYADYWLIETDKEKLKEVIQQLNIKFALLSKETSPEDFDYIYRSNAYQINIDVMRTILSKREQWDDLAFNTRNYSYIVGTYPEMAKYIQNNLSEYVNNVFLKLPNNNDIKLEHLIELLNTETLPVDQKKQIITHLTATKTIECITDISDKSLWTEICNNNLMAANWENIKALVYSEEINFAEVYTKFLNNEENARKLSYQKLEEDIDLDEGKAEIAYTLIYNPNLKDNSYQLLLNSFTGIYSLQLTDLSEKRMRWLLEKNLVEIDVDTYKYLKEHYTPLHIDFLEKHLAEFSKSNYQNMDFDAEDITEILNLPINILEKQKIINTIADTSVLNTDIVIEKLSTFLMNNKIEDFVTGNSLINYIAQQTIVPVDVRKNMYIRYAPHITDITTFLTNLGEPYSSLLQKDIDTDVPLEDEIFLNTLQEYQYIGRFKKRRNRKVWIIKKAAKLFQ